MANTVLMTEADPTDTLKMMTGHLRHASNLAPSPSAAAEIDTRISCLRCCPSLANGFGFSETCIPLNCKIAFLKGIGECGKKIYQAVRCCFPCCLKSEVREMAPVAPGTPEAAAPAAPRTPLAAGTAVLRKSPQKKETENSENKAGYSSGDTAPNSTDELFSSRAKLPGQTDDLEDQ